MKVDDVVFAVFVLALAFLFAGEPDVWDKLHERAMNGEICK
jgi:hypothetical protein